MATLLFNIARICNSQFKWNYLQNGKICLNLLFHFWNLHQILNILKKKMMVLANAFRTLQTAKNLVTPLCKKRRLGTRLDSRHVKVSGIFANLHECAFIMFFHQFD